jgi:signal peptidase II
MPRRLVGRNHALLASAVIACMAVVFDRISKDAAEAALADGPKPFIPGLIDFYLTHNSGAAWGLFQGARGYFIVVATLAVVAVFGYLALQRQHPATVVAALGLFAGGSIGNAIDRALSGRVVDFLRLLFIDFPIFNVADSCITVGAGLLLLAMLLDFRQQRLTEASAMPQAPIGDRGPDDVGT